MAIGCTHRPFHNESYCKFILDEVQKLCPDVFVHCGDLFDQKCVSSFVKNNAPTLKQEYDSANDFLDELNHQLPSKCRKVYIQGNHCSRIFREENNHLSELLDFRIHCAALKQWKVFDYKYHPNSVFKLGQITFAHGFGTTPRSAIAEAVNLSGPYTLYVRSHTHVGYSPSQVLWGQKLLLPYWTANTGCGIRSDVEYFQEHDVSGWNRGYIYGHTKIRGQKHKVNWSADFIQHSKIW